jgi:predicted AlkP superfamily phosphohydrolase/phosphomutase
MPDKILIIGLDGADWRVLRPYLEAGVMPQLARLMEAGVHGNLRSTLPTNSGVAWPSFMTGRNSGKHGVFDFTQRAPNDPTRLVGANSRSIRSETFLAALGRHGRRVGAINVPVSYPPFPVNGFMLGGMFVQEGKPYTYPENLAAELDEHVGGFLPNRIRWRYMLGQFDELLDEAIAVTRQRARVLEYLITRQEWDVLIQVFVSPDRLQHPLMHVLDAQHPGYDRALAQRLAPKFRTYFETIDNALGRAWNLLGAEDHLIVISDHGFRSVHKAVYVREMLAREGFSRTIRQNGSPTHFAKKLLRPLLPTTTRQRLAKRAAANQPVGSPHGMANLIWPQTQAYVTTGTSQGVYINLNGREPKGTVDSAAYDRIVDQIREMLLSEKDPATGRSVIQSVVRSREVFHGPWADAAPDLLYEPAAGYASAKGAKGHLQAYAWFMGDHDPDGIFLAAGRGVQRGQTIEGASLIDVAPTALYLAGAPIPNDMDGKVLDIFADRRLATQPPTYEQDAAAVQAETHVYTAEEERMVEEQLRSLGYL